MTSLLSALTRTQGQSPQMCFGRGSCLSMSSMQEGEGFSHQVAAIPELVCHTEGC